MTPSGYRAGARCGRGRELMRALIALSAMLPLANMASLTATEAIFLGTTDRRACRREACGEAKLFCL